MKPLSGSAGFDRGVPWLGEYGSFLFEKVNAEIKLQSDTIARLEKGSIMFRLEGGSQKQVSCVG
jgi:hypothetical protein